MILSVTVNLGDGAGNVNSGTRSRQRRWLASNHQDYTATPSQVKGAGEPWQDPAPEGYRIDGRAPDV